MHPAHVKLQRPDQGKRGQQTNLTFSPVQKQEIAPVHRQNTGQDTHVGSPPAQKTDPDDVFYYDVARRPFQPNPGTQYSSVRQATSNEEVPSPDEPAQRQALLRRPTTSTGRYLYPGQRQSQSTSKQAQEARCHIHNFSKQTDLYDEELDWKICSQDGETNHLLLQRPPTAMQNSGRKLGTTRRGFSWSSQTQTWAEQGLSGHLQTTRSPRLTLSSLQHSLRAHDSFHGSSDTSTDCGGYVQEPAYQLNRPSSSYQQSSAYHPQLNLLNDTPCSSRPLSCRRPAYPYSTGLQRNVDQQATLQQRVGHADSMYSRPSTNCYPPQSSWERKDNDSRSQAQPRVYPDSDPLQGDCSRQLLQHA